MSVVFDPPVRSIMDLLQRLGDVPPDRVRFDPYPGTATLAHLLDPTNAGCELVDGTLVEKAVSWKATRLGGWLLSLITQFVVPRNLGVVNGEQGLFELPDGPVRGPDVTFVSWDRLPGREDATDAVPQLSPDLAIEVLSPGNTRREMARKRAEYFRGGVGQVWEIDPLARWVRVYTAAEIYTELATADTLTGDPVLPGFTLRLADLFAELDRHG